MKKGFTLSEILITLTIVGVVAALTVPAVMKTTETRCTQQHCKNLQSTLRCNDCNHE